MALTKEQKIKQIENVKEKVLNQKSIVFVDFNKVSSKDIFSLRKTLKESGCNFKIAKKTLIRIALGQLNISFWNKIKPSVPGQMALVLGIEDEIAPARISNKFAKDHETFKILGGIFPSQEKSKSAWEFIDREKVLALATIPPRNELLGRLVGSISSPIASFARVLDKISKKEKS